MENIIEKPNVESTHKVNVVAKIKGSQHMGEEWRSTFTILNEDTSTIVERVTEDFEVKNENTIHVSIPVPPDADLNGDVLRVNLSQVAHDFGVTRTIDPILQNNRINIDLADST